MVGWQSVYALDCKPGIGRLNSYPDLQVINRVNALVVELVDTLVLEASARA